MFDGFYVRPCYRRPKSNCAVEKKQPGAYRELLQTFAKIANGFNFFRKKLYLSYLTSFSYASGVKHIGRH